MASPIKEPFGSEQDRLENKIAALGPWFHNLHLPDGTETAPAHFLGDFPRYKWQALAPHLPSRLDGWTALDIGCNAGYYSFELQPTQTMQYRTSSQGVASERAVQVSVRPRLERPCADPEPKRPRHATDSTNRGHLGHVHPRHVRSQRPDMARRDGPIRRDADSRASLSGTAMAELACPVSKT